MRTFANISYSLDNDSLSTRKKDCSVLDNISSRDSYLNRAVFLRSLNEVNVFIKIAIIFIVDDASYAEMNLSANERKFL